MRLSSSSSGFSKSSVVMFCARSVAGPKRLRMVSSHSRPTTRASCADLALNTLAHATLRRLPLGHLQAARWPAREPESSIVAQLAVAARWAGCGWASPQDELTELEWTLTGWWGSECAPAAESAELPAERPLPCFAWIIEGQPYTTPTDPPSAPVLSRPAGRQQPQQKAVSIKLHGRQPGRPRHHTRCHHRSQAGGCTAAAVRGSWAALAAAWQQRHQLAQLRTGTQRPPRPPTT